MGSPKSFFSRQSLPSRVQSQFGASGPDINVALDGGRRGDTVMAAGAVGGGVNPTAESPRLTLVKSRRGESPGCQ